MKLVLEIMVFEIKICSCYKKITVRLKNLASSMNGSLGQLKDT